MMLILREQEVYLIDRDNNVFAAPQFHFPQRKILKEHIYDTLIDGVREKFSIISILSRLAASLPLLNPSHIYLPCVNQEGE